MVIHEGFWGNFRDYYKEQHTTPTAPADLVTARRVNTVIFLGSGAIDVFTTFAQGNNVAWDTVVGITGLLGAWSLTSQFLTAFGKTRENRQYNKMKGY